MGSRCGDWVPCVEGKECAVESVPHLRALPLTAREVSHPQEGLSLRGGRVKISKGDGSVRISKDRAEDMTTESSER